MKFTTLAATAVAFTFGIAAAVAQTAPAAPAAPKAPVIATTPAPTATPSTAKAKVSSRKQASTPEGIACSQQADAKGLKGKPRVSFRNKCKKEMMAAAAKKN